MDPDTDDDGYYAGHSRFIHDYSYKPYPTFHSHLTDPTLAPIPRVPYLGMELEISTNEPAAGAEILANSVPSLIYCKEDGSVSGFEMVTHPMTLEYAQANLPFTDLRTLRNEHGATGYPNGIHVHVSRSGFTNDTHVYRWMKLLYRNAEQVQLLARRNSTEWASFDNPERVNQKYTAETQRGDKSFACQTYRYSAINVENDQTFEVRVFRGSLRKDEILAALELIDSSVEYSRSLTTHDIVRNHGWDWDKFTVWLNLPDNRDRYSNLIGQIKKLIPADLATSTTATSTTRATVAA